MLRLFVDIDVEVPVSVCGSHNSYQVSLKQGSFQLRFRTNEFMTSTGFKLLIMPEPTGNVYDKVGYFFNVFRVLIRTHHVAIHVVKICDTI